MVKLFIFSSLLLSPLSFSSQVTDDFLSSLSGAKTKPSSTPASKPAGSGADTPIASTSNIEKACYKDQQTSLPLKVLKGLMLDQNHLDVKADAANSASHGVVSVNGGEIIGNCSEMFDINWRIGEGGQQHSMEVAIQKPVNTDCMKELRDGKEIEVCKYQITTADGGISNRPDPTKDFVWVEPNYYGFLECMRHEKVGLYKDGKLDRSKIAKKSFKDKEFGFNSTGPVLYYCHGAECSKDEKNKEIQNLVTGTNSCQHFQNIKPGGISINSRARQQEINMNKAFDNVCNTMNYKYIDRNLDRFGNATALQNVLISIRDMLIKEKVVELKEQLKEDSYEDLDAAEYKEVIGDFYKYIVVPLRQDIEDQYAVVKRAKGDNKKREQKYLDELVLELAQLHDGDYFTRKDYEKMLDFSKKAPLHKADWRFAARNIYKGINTAYHFARYNTKLGKKIQKKKKAAGIDYSLKISPKVAREKMRTDITKEVKRITRLGVLANDSDGSVSYANNHLSEAENVQKSHGRTVQSLQTELNDAYQSQYECFNSAAGMWGLNSTKCLQRSQALQQEIQSDLQYYTHPDYGKYVMNPAIQEQMNLANFWTGVERDRNLAYGITPQARSSRMSDDPRVTQNPNFSQNFLQNQMLQREALINQWNKANGNQQTWQNFNFRNPSANQPQQGYVWQQR